MSTNPLNTYDLYTYNFSLYIVNPLTNDRALLAQTAKSPYFIDNVEIMSVVTPTKKYSTSLAIEFSFTIKEPNGSFFLQYLQEQALSIGVDNYIKTLFDLELKFVGNTENRMGIVDANTNQWRIVFLEVDVDIDSSGSTYNFKAVTSNQLANANQYGIIPEAVSIEATNINDYFSTLSDELSKMGKNKKATHSEEGKEDIYRFVFDPEVVGSGDFVDDSPQQFQSSLNEAPFDQETWDRQNIQITENMEIPRLIDNAIMSTKHFQTVVKKSFEAETDENRSYTEKQFYFIRTETIPIGYDTGRQDYRRLFLYQVVPYSKIITRGHSAEFFQEEPPSNILKNYQYNFTEQNLDVLNLDVKFNFSGVLPTTSQAGITNTNKSSQVGARLITDETREVPQNFVEKIDNDYTFSGPTQAYSLGQLIDTLVEGYDDHHGDTGFPSDRSPSRKLASSYWTNSLMSFQNNMLQIDLEIRGDPEWLQETNELAIEGDILFSLRVESPRPSDIEGEWYPHTQNLILSGYYQLLKITSRFSDGKFTQTLNAIRHHRNVFEGGS